MMDKSHKLSRLFECIVRGSEPSRVLNAAGGFIGTVEPKDIVNAEKEMLESGYSISELKRLYPAERQILKEQAEGLMKLLPPNHLVYKIISEHQLYLCYLADLEDVNREIWNSKVLSVAGTDFRKLTHIARSIVMSLDHLHLEDELIFPELERHGYLGTPQILTTEHLSMALCAEKLMELVVLAENGIIEMGKFKSDLYELATTIVSMGREHIFREDNILYPIAIQLIEDSSVWEKIKALSEEVGYFTM
jgi:DUF438 domain-containing protein